MLLADEKTAFREITRMREGQGEGNFDLRAIGFHAFSRKIERREGAHTVGRKAARIGLRIRALQHHHREAGLAFDASATKAPNEKCPG